MKKILPLAAATLVIAASSASFAAAPKAADLLTTGVKAIKRYEWSRAAEVTQAALDMPGLSATQEAAALNNLCVALSHMPDFDEALTVCNKAVEAAPDKWNGYLNRGTLLASIGHDLRAKADYTTAKSLNPSQDVTDLALVTMHFGNVAYFSAMLPAAGNVGVQRAEAQ